MKDTGRVQVVEETVADDDMIMIKGCKEARSVTVLLRGPNDYMLDEMERSLHDAFCIVKRVLESGEVVPGEYRQLIGPEMVGSECRHEICACISVFVRWDMGVKSPVRCGSSNRGSYS